MPRIKDINSLVFFKLYSRLNYDRIDSLFSGSINFNITRQHYREMLLHFLLEYIQDIELRETVNARTCKCEEFKNFLQCVFFYNNGMIQENPRYAQDKMIAYNHLVANLVILHNVDSMSKAINKL